MDDGQRSAWNEMQVDAAPDALEIAQERIEALEEECLTLANHGRYLEAKVERLLELIQVHVDPTGFEDDPDMQMAMREVAALEGKQE